MQCLHCSKGSELCNINSDFGWRTLESLSLNLFGWLVLGSCVAAWLSSAAERSENKCYCIALRSSPALHQRWPKVLVTAYEALHLIDLWVGSVQRGAPILLQPLLQSLNFSLSIQLKQRWWMSCWTHIIFRFTLIAQDVFRWCSLSRDAVGGAGWTCSRDSVGGGLRKSGSVTPSQISDVLWQSSRRGLTYLSLIFCWSKAITA